jgi:hypothetical protein
MIEFFPPVQNLINILPHDRMNLVQIICQLGILFVVVAAIVVAAIPIVALLFLYDGIVMDELKWTSSLGNGNAPLAMMITMGRKQGGT